MLTLQTVLRQLFLKWMYVGFIPGVFKCYIWQLKLFQLKKGLFLKGILKPLKDLEIQRFIFNRTHMCLLEHEGFMFQVLGCIKMYRDVHIDAHTYKENSIFELSWSGLFSLVLYNAGELEFSIHVFLHLLLSPAYSKTKTSSWENSTFSQEYIYLIRSHVDRTQQVNR